MNGSGLMGFGKPEEDEFKPNRAQRRAHDQMVKRRQRRGQRAYERALREGDGKIAARRKGDAAAMQEES